MTRKLPAFPGLCVVLALILLCAVEAGAQSAQVPARITLPLDETSLVTLHGNTHPLARAEFDQGAAQASLPMKRILLILQRSPDQESALGQLLQQQQDNSSPNYHKWLTPEQFGTQFGPAPQDIQSITTWLESHGFQVAGASRGGILIEFSGTAGQVQQAFHTQIHKYAVNGAQHYANASDPMVPAGLVPMVAGLRALNNFPAKPMNPADFPAQVDINHQLMALAFQCDVTRVITFMHGHGLGGRSFPFIGVNENGHTVSHHSGVPAVIAQEVLIDSWRITQFAAFLQMLKALPDVDGNSVLHNTVVYYTSEIADGQTHSQDNKPGHRTAERICHQTSGRKNDAHGTSPEKSYRFDPMKVNAPVSVE